MSTAAFEPNIKALKSLTTPVWFMQAKITERPFTNPKGYDEL
jgi:hypothetical protein